MDYSNGSLIGGLVWVPIKAIGVVTKLVLDPDSLISVYQNKCKVSQNDTGTPLLFLERL